ncbi:MAG: LysM peptidoglycan-binding domain-containing protein [Verrucomicrobiae bacterium]|nr:LysM peptidoglycan-binding domain-containing protein [Verrucomicrobiae bacterium]NNJ43955.1 LysM peptidoglycan-binding domain-containing protein [Akkermansiaceae bacterium]
MKRTIQTKRNKPPGSHFRVLYAKTGRKRRLNAATATADPHIDLESDVPNVGIGRALLIILVLHILAIAAIYVHSTFFGNDAGSTTNASKTTAAAVDQKKAPDPVVAAVTPSTAVPLVDESASARYIVVTGDTYQRVAQVRHVDEQSLRALNSNRPLRAGVVLDLPAELSTRPVEVSDPPATEPAVAVVVDESTPAEAPFRAVASGSELDVSGAPKAVVVKPTVGRPAVSSDVLDSGQRYTIKSGDTLWRISTRYKVSRDNILKLNGIKDPNKLYAGRDIKIPKR